MQITPEDVVIPALGEATLDSPLRNQPDGAGQGSFVSPQTRVRYQVEYGTGRDRPENIFFEKAGPREKIFFKPEETRAAIVTCGGLSPGLNNVIRSAFRELCFNYGVRDILGIRYGYQGLNPMQGLPPIQLTPQMVDDIHDEGGTILGSSRGWHDPAIMTDFLKKQCINILLCVGGEGTQNGASQLAREAQKRKLNLAVVGIPKTIDNDLPFVSQTFGFNTAIQASRVVLNCAHSEATSAYNGIGLVKLMGRYAGFIACGATIANQDVNFTLIPEVSFKLDGPRGFLETLRKRILARGHAVIVVAEGAGQDLIKGDPGQDGSGHPKLKDIGEFLRNTILAYFKSQDIPTEVKYFDPSYIIRSVPADCSDAMLSDQLARYAVHAAMAGKTDCFIGHTNNVFIHVPISLASRSQKRVWPDSELWRSVLATTRQPAVFE